MIQIKCSTNEKKQILNALSKAGVCPFDEECHEMKYDYGIDHDKCRAANIKWEITDKSDDKSEEELDDTVSVTVTEKSFAEASSRAITMFIHANPMRMIIAEELTELMAYTMCQIFKGNKEEK